MSRPIRRGALAAALLLPTLAMLPTAATSLASNPASSALTVPSTAGRTVSAAFTGTADPGAFATSACPSGSVSDTHAVAVAVPAGVYDSLTASFRFGIAWDDTSVLGNDLILTVVGPDGAVLGSSDGSAPSETLTLTNLGSGTYTTWTCSFVGAETQDYDGEVSITTSSAADPGAGPATLPTVDRGLEFSSSVVTDPQRSQGESAAFVDPAGVLYSCGTNGASNGTDHGAVSVDGGETWRALGTGPIGETGTAQGGGDCAIGTAQDPNSEGNYQLAFIGLGPLTGFSTFSSPDNGRTLARSPSQNGLEFTNQQSLVDRQWLTFTDDKTVFLNYNAAIASVGAASGQIIQKSVDGGLTYGPQQSVATDGARLGQIKAIKEGVVPGIDPTEDVVYFPYTSGTKVKLALSQDGGTTWSQCLAVDAGVDPQAGFVAADHDSEGNLYVVYAEKGGGRDTYLVSLPADKVADCKGANPVTASNLNNVDPGFTTKTRVNREGVETTVMPWVAAGGAPGHAAVAFYGTPTVGDPDAGTFKASWDVYVSQTVDAFAATPSIDQAKATTHPNHYDSICLNGLGCDVSMGDRSLVDYFSMGYDATRDRIVVVYNQAAKTPGAAEGNIAAAVVLTQRAGVGNSGATLPAAPEVLRTGSADVVGDAFARWTTSDSLLGSPATNLPGANLPALDLLGVEVGPEVDLATGDPVADGGFTVTMSYADLRSEALQAALTGGQGTSLVYLFRFFDGFQPGGAAAYYEGGLWRFGMNDYTTTVRNAQGNVQTYEGATTIEGTVDQVAGTISLSVPRAEIEVLTGGTGAGQTPSEVKATDGTRVYDAAAWSFVNTLPTNQSQSYLGQVDNTAPFDFRIGATGPAPVVPEVPVAVLLPLAAMLLAAAAVGIRRRRTVPLG